MDTATGGYIIPTCCVEALINGDASHRCVIIHIPLWRRAMYSIRRLINCSGI